MSAGSDDLYNTVSPTNEQAEELIEIIESLPTLSPQDLREEYEQKYPNTSIWNDENTGYGGLEQKYRPAALDLPGFGEKYDGSQGRIPCGAKIPHVCKDCGHDVDIGSTCRRSRCPRCAPSWVLKTAPGIVENIMGAAKMMSKDLDTAVYKHHGVISPPPETYINAENPERACIEAIQDMMESMNLQGIALYHPWSGKSDGKGFEESHKDDRGEWKKRLFAGREWEGDVREELQHRPHFHVIGACPWFPGGDTTKQVYDETGWVIHRITGRNGSAVSLGSRQDVARAVVYALSHTAIDTRGSQNKYVFGKKGPKYFAHDPEHPQYGNLDQSRAAVYAVAPKLLGIDDMEVSCTNEVAEEDCEHEHDELEEGDGTDEGDDTDTDETRTRRCNSDLCDIDSADFVETEEWQNSVPDPAPAVRKRQKWHELGGWQGWIAEQTGQTTLPDNVGDDPPG